MVKKMDKEEKSKKDKTEVNKEEKKEKIGPQNQSPKEKIIEKKGDVKEIKKDFKKEAPEEEHILEIVRILSTDLNGKLNIKNSLRKIKGVSFVTSKIFCEKAHINPEKITGKLKDDEIKKLEEVLKNPKKFNIPNYILNLRKNPYTGNDEHFTGVELQMETRKILGDMRKLGSYVGMRHRYGLPVRGQRTRSSFRKSKSVGVSKKRPTPGKK